jgi:hypothetical protein
MIIDLSVTNTPAATVNPFCTRRVRPGAMPFFFDADPTSGGLSQFSSDENGTVHLSSATVVSLSDLLDRLRHNGWRGQIVGPHGSGKSALLAALVPLLEQAGRRALSIVLHDGQRSVPRCVWDTTTLDGSTQVIVDGYEQLARWNRFLLQRFCKRRGMGLLVTAHAPAGLPELFRTSVSLETAQQIVQRLQGDAPLVTPADVAEQFSRHQGNMREMLFALYDLHEERFH